MRSSSLSGVATEGGLVREEELEKVRGANESLQKEEEAPATVLSKSMVEEEGEIFRKGAILLGPQELGEEGAGIDSEELKREVRVFFIGFTELILMR